MAAMESEYASILANKTWSLVPLPLGQKAITTRWVYHTKPGPHGIGLRYKARLVARGFQQRHGIDYHDTFAPVVKWETIRLVIAIATHPHWQILHLDVQTAFLNNTLQEEVYVTQPQGFIFPGSQHLVCRLHRALYGLRQSPRAWYSRMENFLLSLNLQKSSSDPNMYFL